MLYAQIKDGVVKNIMVLQDLSKEGIFSTGFDLLLRVDELPVIPGVGWTYANGVFTEVVIIDEDRL